MKAREESSCTQKEEPHGRAMKKPPVIIPEELPATATDKATATGMEELHAEEESLAISQEQLAMRTEQSKFCGLKRNSPRQTRQVMQQPSYFWLYWVAW